MCLETVLKCFTADQPRTWLQWLHWAKYWYSTTYHETTGVTPIKVVVYGRKPLIITRFLQGETIVEADQRDSRGRDEALRWIKHHLLQAQERIKGQADRKRKKLSFTSEEWILLEVRIGHNR